MLLYFDIVWTVHHFAIYTGSAKKKKKYTHFNGWYLCIVFEVELNYRYNM
jgi:hypothetical protein